MALTSVIKSLQNLGLNQCVRYISSNLSNKHVRVNQFSYVIKKHNMRLINRVRFYSEDTSLPGVDPFALPKPKRKKTMEVPKITLFDEYNQKSITNMEQAQRLAKSRNLKLVKIEAVSSDQKASYKLMTTAKYLEVDSEKQAKNEPVMTKKKKMILISSKITDHDLENKIKNIIKAVMKKHKIHVIVSNEGGEQGISNVVRGIEKGIKGYGKMDKKVTSKNTKFSILPIDQTDETSSNEKDVRKQTK